MYTLNLRRKLCIFAYHQPSYRKMGKPALEKMKLLVKMNEVAKTAQYQKLLVEKGFLGKLEEYVYLPFLFVPPSFSLPFEHIHEAYSCKHSFENASHLTPLSCTTTVPRLFLLPCISSGRTNLVCQAHRVFFLTPVQPLIMPRRGVCISSKTVLCVFFSSSVKHYVRPTGHQPRA